MWNMNQYIITCISQQRRSLTQARLHCFKVLVYEFIAKCCWLSPTVALMLRYTGAWQSNVAAYDNFNQINYIMPLWICFHCLYPGQGRKHQNTWRPHSRGAKQSEEGIRGENIQNQGMDRHHWLFGEIGSENRQATKGEIWWGSCRNNLFTIAARCLMWILCSAENAKCVGKLLQILCSCIALSPEFCFWEQSCHSLDMYKIQSRNHQIYIGQLLQIVCSCSKLSSLV